VDGRRKSLFAGPDVGLTVQQYKRQPCSREGPTVELHVATRGARYFGDNYSAANRWNGFQVDGYLRSPHR